MFQGKWEFMQQLLTQLRSAAKASGHITLQIQCSATQYPFRLPVPPSN